MDGYGAQQPRKYSGVSLNKKAGKYRARYYRADGSRTWLKEDFATAEAAARAYDAAVLKDGLPAQTLNFVSPLDALRNSASKFKPKATNAEAGDEDDKMSEATTSTAKATTSDSASSGGMQWPRKRKRDYQSPADKKEPGNKAKQVKKKKKKKEEEVGAEKEGKDSLESEESSEDEDSDEDADKKTKKKATRSKGSKRKSKAERKRLRAGFEAKAKETAEAAVEAAGAGGDEPASVSVWTMPDLDLVRAAGVPSMAEVGATVALCRAHRSYERYFGSVAQKAVAEKWVSCGDFEDEDEDDEPRLFSLDCEMVLCRPVGEPGAKAVSTLARASLVQCLVGEDKTSTTYKVVFDEYVRVDADAEVVDLLTHVSGIRQCDLDDASLTKKDVQQLILKNIRGSDIVVGHSLWADFAAAEFWHDAFVDTSSLCAVRGLDNVTLSLKDVARGILVDKAEQEQFQKDGQSHDSIADAEWSIRVMFRLITLAKVTKTELPLLFDDIPGRYKTRLTFHMLPAGTVEGDVRALVQRYLPTSNGDEVRADTEVKPIRWHVVRGGHKQGSCIVELDTPAVAKHVFDAMHVVQSGCGGFNRSGPCHPEGFPDRQNMVRKLIFAPGTAPAVNAAAAKKADADKSTAHVTCEVICFFPVKLARVKKVVLKAQTLGRVLGKGGSMIRMIQQVSGARVSVTRQPDKTATEPELRDTAQLEVAAENGKKMNAAVGLIHLCVQKKLKLS